MRLLNVITNNSELELTRKKAGAHPRPQFSVDERLSMVLICTETNSVLERTKCFQRQLLDQRTVQTNINGQVYGQVCQDGLPLNKNVGNRGYQRTTRTEATETGSTLSNDSLHMKKSP